MGYVLILLIFALLAVLGLVSFTAGAGPAFLKPVQGPIAPVTNAVKPVAGVFGIIAVFLAIYGLIDTVVGIAYIGSGGRLVLLLIFLVLAVVGVLAGYSSVAAYFGAPASGFGKLIEWVKTTFSPFEAIVGAVSVLLAIFVLLKFILNISGVYFI